jgi:hypothetical protein
LIRRFLIICTVAALAGCGDDGAAGPDAGMPPATRLVVQDPPGDDLGLPPNSRVTLRVRHETELGDPIPGTRVDFVMQPGPGGTTGGSTLSASAAETDATGVAQVDLVVGAERAMFRVTATAANAPAASFYVNVSPGGFAELIITPVHEGPRAAELFDRVEVRMYRTAELHCSELDLAAPPDSPFPPRTLPGFGGSAELSSISAGEPHTLLAWAEVSGAAEPIAVGCVDLDGAGLLATRVLVDVPVADRALGLPPALGLVSAIDLNALATAIEVAGIDRPWRRLACPAGPGQVLLDCALDAHAGDGELDCVIQGDSPLIDALEAARGTPGPDGCRPAQLGAEPSLDARLTAAIEAGGGFPTGAALDQLLEARRDTLTAVELASEITPAGPGVARHRLLAATIELGGAAWDTSLVASSRPIVSATAAYGLDAASLTLGDHGFTLDYGALAAAAFEELALAPAGLDPTTLGASLAASASQGNLTGCAAASALICADAGQAASCLQSACNAAAAALDQRFAAWWQALDDDGVDLWLTGTIAVSDLDLDLIAAPAPGGAWEATFTLAGGSTVEAPGTAGPAPLP